MKSRTPHIAKSIGEEIITLDQLTELGYAKLYELKQIGYRRLFSLPKDEMGNKQAVIIDNNNRHWDYNPESDFYILSDDLNSPYLEEL